MNGPLSLLLAGCVLGASSAAAVETMRIEMGEVPGQVSVSGAQLAAGEDSETGAFAPQPGDRATVELRNGSLLVGGVRLSSLTVRLRAGALQGDGSGPGQGTLQAGRWTVRGDVVVRAHNDSLQLINVIPLEDYVAAVLGGEMPVTFPPEALKAQAVAARTYALSRKLAMLGAPFFLGSGVLSQVYGGVHREDVRTRRATAATAGWVLTYGLAPIEAYFHSSCGGKTESGLAALGRDLPYLKSVDCPCGATKASHWTVDLPRSALATSFKDSGPLVVTSRSSTGRARRIQIGSRSIDGATFRQRLGYDRVKSLAFDVRREGPGRFRLEGQGWGHGAGLCQVGAKALATQGWEYTKILAHYYPGTQLQQLY